MQLRIKTTACVSTSQWISIRDSSTVTTFQYSQSQRLCNSSSFSRMFPNLWDKSWFFVQPYLVARDRAMNSSETCKISRSQYLMNSSGSYLLGAGHSKCPCLVSKLRMMLEKKRWCVIWCLVRFVYSHLQYYCREAILVLETKMWIRHAPPDRNPITQGSISRRISNTNSPTIHVSPALNTFESTLPPIEMNIY